MHYTQGLLLSGSSLLSGDLKRVQHCSVGLQEKEKEKSTMFQFTANKSQYYIHTKELHASIARATFEKFRCNQLANNSRVKI